jgi:hypothetical protein
MRTLQKFVAVHGSVHNHFDQERHLYSRSNFKLTVLLLLPSGVAYPQPDR